MDRSLHALLCKFRLHAAAKEKIRGRKAVLKFISEKDERMLIFTVHE